MQFQDIYGDMEGKTRLGIRFKGVQGIHMVQCLRMILRASEFFAGLGRSV